MLAQRRPAAPALRHASLSTTPASSQRSRWGANSRAKNRRAWSRRIPSSSVIQDDVRSFMSGLSGRAGEFWFAHLRISAMLLSSSISIFLVTPDGQMAKQARSPWQRKQEDRTSVREEKRLAVLRAGAAAFRERGFEKTSLDDIAGKLGVTKPTLYYYISAKQDIVYASSSLANGELMALARSQDPKRPGLESLTDFFR